MRWTDLTTEDFAALSGSDAVAVLPVGATEQHGPHLPLGTDTMICEALTERAAGLAPAGVRVLLLPVMPVGLSPEHGDFPGTLTFSPATVIAAWTGLGEAVARAGVRRLVIVNSHGGQPQAVDIVAQQLRSRHGMACWQVNAYRWFRDQAHFPPDVFPDDIHGGGIETSIMLYLRPDLVRMEKARDFRVAGGAGSGDRAVGRAWQMQDLNPAGAAGNAAAADAARGQAVFEAAAGALASVFAGAAATGVPEQAGALQDIPQESQDRLQES